MCIGPNGLENLEKCNFKYATTGFDCDRISTGGANRSGTNCQLELTRRLLRIATGVPHSNSKLKYWLKMARLGKWPKLQCKRATRTKAKCQQSRCHPSAKDQNAPQGHTNHGITGPPGTVHKLFVLHIWKIWGKLLINFSSGSLLVLF